MVDFKKCLSNYDYKQVSLLAKKTWHTTYQNILSNEQITYMLMKFLSIKAIKENIKKGYNYELIYDDNILIGFTAYIIDSSQCFLSKLYLVNEYQGKGIMRMLLERLLAYNLPITLTVNKYNSAYHKYLHLGFKVYDEVVNDIGLGYVMDDYLMRLDGENYVK